ncbi:GON domain protein [Trichuris suis]|nr:GON domain protein [Trichuris suis]
METAARYQISQKGPKNCYELRQMRNTSADGEYTIWARGSALRIYCYGMKNLYPKEYLTLQTDPLSNFAEFYGKRLLNSASCPYDGKRNDSCVCTEESNPPPGLTRFHRINIDLDTLRFTTDTSLRSNMEALYHLLQPVIATVLSNVLR